MIEFFYTADYLTEIKDPAGNSYLLSYDSGNLSSIEYPDTSKLNLYYEDPNDPHNLTSIKNTGLVTIASWSYNEDDLAVSSSGYNGKEAVTINYPDNFQDLISSH